MIALLLWTIGSFAADDAPAKIETVDDATITARWTAVRDGGLVLDSDPPRSIPLDEILRIDFGRESKPLALGSEPAAVLVHMEGGDRLRGTFESLDDKYLAVSAAAGANRIDLPLAHVLGIQFGKLDPDGRTRFENLLESPAADDIVLMTGRESGVAQVAGRAGGIADGKLELVFEGESRGVNRDRLLALVFARHPKAADRGRFHQEFHLTTGETLAGTLLALEGDDCRIRTFWDQTVTLAVPSLASITCRNGKLVYLSDLEPVAVEETPYFARTMPYRRDRSLEGGALKLAGETFGKGLAVHSRCVLTYSLGGRYDVFESRVGFADDAADRGNVRCRVLGDGRELFVRDPLTRQDPPVAIELTVTGVDRLALEVDFGANLDIGDRILWAKARLRAGEGGRE